MHRRDFMKTVSLGVLASGLARGPRVFAQSKPVAFDHAWLKNRARALAAKPYAKRSRELPQVLAERDWDQFHFRPERALWSKLDSRFAVQFFHRSKLFRERIEVFEVVNGRATPVTYDPGMFDYARSNLRADTLPPDIGFAGLRLTFDRDQRDVTSFLGASYFRAVADNYQWGLSARGLAVNAGVGKTEEFPTFTSFWLERPAPGVGTLVIYALLDSESITGAYRFAIAPGKSQVMDVDATLFPRKPIERLGIAPGTSMFQCGENDKRMANDVRPEIHDSDGLAMWTGKNEWIWRPLANPAAVERHAFADDSPKGFGLLQRDRDFESYQDDQILYQPRPDLWVEPRSNWGRGTVQLLEIPTVDETNDNIVSFFCPEQAVKPGQELRYAYRLHWALNPPVLPELARTSATRLGLGGVVGQRKRYSGRFMVDFTAKAAPPSAAIEPVVQVSRGTVELATARVLRTDNASGPTRYRAVFDIVPPDDSTAEIEVRMFLRSGGKPLTETWLYHWIPPAANARKFQ